MPTHPAITTLRDRLARLRSRIRRLLAVSGLARVVAYVAALLTASLLADWLLDLPLVVRRFLRLGLLDRPEGLGFVVWALALVGAGAGFLAAARRRSGLAGPFAFVAGGGVGLVAWAVGRHLVSPLRIRLPDEALALTVEERFRRLNDRVAAALDFEGEIASPTRGESTAMMERVVEDAAREAESLRFETVASGRRVARLVGVAALASGVLAGLVAAMPSTAALWARRSLLLEDVAWPQATTLVAVVRDAEGRESEKDPAVPYTAALGQSLTVIARAKGKVPSEVEIVDRVLADGREGRPLAHRMRPLPDTPGCFEHEFRDVRADFVFTLRGGDDRDEAPTYRVVVRVPPRIATLRADLVFPAYLGLPPRRVEGGTLTVPEGTKATVAFEADTAVAKAEAFLDDAPAPLERDGPAWRFAFEAKKSLRYRLRIVTPDGRENDAAVDTYEVTVEPDTPPRPEWVWPRAPVEATPKARVPLFAQTRDDHGVADLRLEVAAAGATETKRIPLGPRVAGAPEGANDRPYGADSILSYVPFEVAGVLDKDGKPLVAPTRFQVRLVATDTKGQEGAGPWASVDVLRPDEVERGFAGQRARVKSEMDGIRADVRAMRETAAGLASAATLGEAERQVLRDLQFRQGKARVDLERSVRTITALFTSYVYDRLGAEVPTERLLALFDRHHRAAFDRATDLKGAPAGTDGESVPSDTDVFPWSLYTEVVDARRDRTVFDTGVIDKMITVLEHSVDAVVTLAPAAQEAAAQAARGGTAADVAALVQAQDRLLQGLDRALSAMAEWQSLSELTLFLRRLIEEQETLHRDIKDLNK